MDGEEPVRRGEVAADGRVVHVQLTVGAQVIALLRDGEGHDAGVGRGEARQHRGGLFGGDQHLAQGADHLRRRLVPQPDQGVEAVLRLQGVARSPPASNRSYTGSWWARKKAPGPRWTTPTCTSSRS